MVELKVKVWRKNLEAFENAISKERDMVVTKRTADNRESPYILATVRAAHTWDVFNVLSLAGKVEDITPSHTWLCSPETVFEFGTPVEDKPDTTGPVTFELDCPDEESAWVVCEILKYDGFSASVKKRMRNRIVLLHQLGYEGLKDARECLRAFGLKLSKRPGKFVYNVKEAR